MTTNKRGRPRLNYVFDPNNPVYRARKAVDHARQEFDREVALLWRERSLGLQADLYRAVLEQVNNGTSVAELCRMYDTTSRNTIYDLIERARAAFPVTTEDNRVTVRALSDDENPEGFPNPHRVTLENGDVVDVYVTPDRVGVITTPDAQHTHDVLDKTGPVWDALLEAGIID